MFGGLLFCCVSTFLLLSELLSKVLVRILPFYLSKASQNATLCPILSMPLFNILNIISDCPWGDDGVLPSSHPRQDISCSAEVNGNPGICRVNVTNSQMYTKALACCGTCLRETGHSPECHTTRNLFQRMFQDGNYWRFQVKFTFGNYGLHWNIVIGLHVIVLHLRNIFHRNIYTVTLINRILTNFVRHKLNFVNSKSHWIIRKPVGDTNEI